MKWTWDGGFIAHKLHHDGTTEERKFTSSAQARQFVEKHEDCKLTKKITSPNSKQRKRRTRKNGHYKSVSQLTPAQMKLKEDALKQFKGLI